MVQNFFLDPPGWMQTILWLSFLYLIFRTCVWFLFHSKPFRALILARLHNVPIGFFDLLLISLRKSDPVKLVKAYLCIHQIDDTVEFSMLEDFERLGGDPEKACAALIAAKKAGAECSLETILAAQMKGDKPGDLSEACPSSPEKAASEQNSAPTPGALSDRAQASNNPESAR